MGTHLKVLSESHPMNTKMTSVIVLWTKVASALEGLRVYRTQRVEMQFHSRENCNRSCSESPLAPGDSGESGPSHHSSAYCTFLMNGNVTPRANPLNLVFTGSQQEPIGHDLQTRYGPRGLREALLRDVPQSLQDEKVISAIHKACGYSLRNCYSTMRQSNDVESFVGFVK